MISKPWSLYKTLKTQSTNFDIISFNNIPRSKMEDLVIMSWYFKTHNLQENVHIVPIQAATT
jgi:hypothetical protein